jgi:hypothetical protein
VRSFTDVKQVLATLQGTSPVLVVIHASDADRSRCLDVLTGWAFGSGGDLDGLGPNAVLARPPGAPPARFARTQIASVVDQVLTAGDPLPDRDEEQHLRSLATTGNDEARRRLVDSYLEVANLLALVLCPKHLSQATALRVAHEELERVASWAPRDTPMLVALTNAVHERLSSREP